MSSVSIAEVDPRSFQYSETPMRYHRGKPPSDLLEAVQFRAHYFMPRKIGIDTLTFILWLMEHYLVGNENGVFLFCDTEGDDEGYDSLYNAFYDALPTGTALHWTLYEFGRPITLDKKKVLVILHLRVVERLGFGEAPCSEALEALIAADERVEKLKRKIPVFADPMDTE